MPQFTTFLIQHGVPQEVLVWLLLAPIAATLVVIARHIIGIRGIGITTPLLIGFAFAATGLARGAAIFLSALAIGFFIRLLLARARLLYLPKLVLILSGVTFFIIFLLPLLATAIGKSFSLSGTAFPFVILILSVEQFIALLNERGLKNTIGIILEVVTLALLTSALLTWQWLAGVIVAYPLFVIVVIFLINLGLARWTGLRLSEYMRFKDIIFK